jgi:hypothetical protein
VSIIPFVSVGDKERISEIVNKPIETKAVLGGNVEGLDNDSILGGVLGRVGRTKIRIRNIFILN